MWHRRPAGARRTRNATRRPHRTELRGDARADQRPDQYYALAGGSGGAIAALQGERSALPCARAVVRAGLQMTPTPALLQSPPPLWRSRRHRMGSPTMTPAIEAPVRKALRLPSRAPPSAATKRPVLPPDLVARPHGQTSWPDLMGQTHGRGAGCVRAAGPGRRAGKTRAARGLAPLPRDHHAPPTAAGAGRDRRRPGIEQGHHQGKSP